MTSIYTISMIDSNGEWKQLQGFVGPASEAYTKANARLEHWCNKYPNAVVDILRADANSWHIKSSEKARAGLNTAQRRTVCFQGTKQKRQRNALLIASQAMSCWSLQMEHKLITGLSELN